MDKDTWVEIELAVVPTLYSGACFVMQAKSQQNWPKHFESVYVGYNKDLDLLDVGILPTTHITIYLEHRAGEILKCMDVQD